MIANLMQTRKHRVVFVTPSTSYEVVLGKDQMHSGLEIEEPIVADVVRKCFVYVSRETFGNFFDNLQVCKHGEYMEDTEED